MHEGAAAAMRIAQTHHDGYRVFDDKWQNLNPRRRLVIEWPTQL
jgi:hypothetical protein